MRKLFKLVGEVTTNGLDTTISNLQKAERQARKTGGSIGDVGTTFLKLAGPLKIAAGALGAFFAAAQFSKMTSDAIAFGSSINDMANRLGITTGEFQKLDFVAKQSGTSAEALSKSFKQVAINSYEAYHGNQAAAASFDMLGVAIRDSNGNLRDSSDIFNDLLIAVSKIENPTERAAVASKAFGKSSMEVMAIVSQGEGEIRKMIKAQEDYNLVLNDDAVKALDDAGDQLDVMKQSASLLSAELVVTFVPALTKVVEWLTKAVSLAREFWKKEDPALAAKKKEADYLSALISLYEQQFDTSEYRQGLGLVIKDNETLNTEVQNLEKNLGDLGTAFSGDLLSKMETARMRMAELNAEISKPKKAPGVAFDDPEEAARRAKEAERLAKENADKRAYWQEELRKVTLDIETQGMQDDKNIIDEKTANYMGLVQARLRMIEMLDQAQKDSAEFNISLQVEEKKNALKSLKEFAEKAKDTYNAIVDTASQIFGQVNDIMQGVHDNEVIRIDQRLQKDIEAVTASTMGEKQKADAIKQLEEDADKKKKEIAVKAAKREKASAIFSIILSTAEAIMKAVAQLGPIAGAIAGVAMGILGAAQIAVVAARPLPMKKGGLVKGNKGGIVAQVGESTQDEIVVPLETGMDLFVKKFTDKIDSVRLPSFNKSQASGAAAGGSSTSRQVVHQTHLNVGTFIGDERGLRELERRIRPVRIAENMRLGLA